jgi:hypothetical protein
VAWPGIRRIAADCGIARSTAEAAIRELESFGLLHVDHVEGNPSHQTNRYYVQETYRESGRPENRDVLETGQGRPENRVQDVPKFGTEPDQGNQTNRPRPRRGFFSICPEEEGKGADAQMEALPEPKAIAGRNRKANPSKQKQGRNRKPEEVNPLEALCDGQRWATDSVGRILGPWPPRVDQAIYFARTEAVPIPADFVKEWHGRKCSEGWKFPSGIPLENWQQSLRAAWRHEAKRRSATA